MLKRPRVLSAALGGLLSVLAACSEEPARIAPTRGFVLISIDTLRADHVGAYGAARDTTPFLDRLAARGVLFENAIVQLPGTLPSHMSIFTGLYPGEHGVYPPEAVLSPAIETLPEAFSRSGFRTAGFTEGGYASGRYGFERGFAEFSDAAEGLYDDVERTFARGLSFLRQVDDSEPFFLFLHTYAVHDPYDPPEPYRSMFWTEEPPRVFSPTGTNLAAVNQGLRKVTPEQVRYFEALYDGGIRYLDSVLEEWFGEVEALGLLESTTVVITSDHGEEFLDHGKLVHEQIYHENLHVPLVVLHPEVAGGARVEQLVQSIDIAPTLYEVAGIRPKETISGRSLVPNLVGEAAPLAKPRLAFAEDHSRADRALYHQSHQGLFHLLSFQPVAEESGTWIDRSVRFETRSARLAFRGMSFHEPRDVEVFVDGERTDVLSLDPSWSPFSVELPPAAPGATGRRRVELRASGCVAPSEVGPSPDTRCLSFKVRDLPLERSELYDVAADPEETRDLADERERLHRELHDRLTRIRFQVAAPPLIEGLDPQLQERLKGLGYLQ